MTLSFGSCRLGFEASDEAIDETFDLWDPDGSGTLEFKELSKLLRRGADIELAAELQVGAAGEIVLEAENKVALRKAKVNKADSVLLQGLDLDESSDKTIGEQVLKLDIACCPECLGCP